MFGEKRDCITQIWYVLQEKVVSKGLSDEMTTLLQV